jgi:uncharacterized protein YbjT (DUF2867 family)
MMYAITGATGNTGRIIAEKLLGAGKKVTIIGRSAKKLQPLVDKGAAAAVGSVLDTAFLSKAFQGAKALYAMIPPSFEAEKFRAYQNAAGEGIATAIQNAGVKYVVNLSSLGAHLPEGTGPIAGLYDQEQRLNKIKGLNVLHLRPTYFMENLLDNIDMIKNMGIMGSSVKGELKFPMIAIKDIGEYAAKRLLNLDFSGSSVQDLLGPRDLTLNEVTQVLGRAIGKENLKYVVFPYEESEKAMIGMGLKPDLARSYTEMARSFNEGQSIKPGRRDSVNTTPTTIEEFAEVFAAAYKNS